MHYALLDEVPHQARSLIHLSGPDTRRFVQGTISADVESMADDVAVAAGLCTVKGKLISEVVAVCAGEDGMDLLVPSSTADAVAESIDRHIIMDDVTVTAPVSTSLAVAWDTGEDAPPPVVEGADVRTFSGRHPGPGRLVVGVRDAVLAAVASGTAVDAQGWAARRINTATPAWGYEIQADVFAPEVGFIYSVSFDKGCFMGQEPLARIHARGQVNRVMVRVAIDGAPGDVPEPLVDDGGTEVGRLSTWAPGGKSLLGLAVVRRKVAAPGHVLRSGDRTVEVITPPLGDDPGLPTKKRAATVKLGRR